MRLATLFALVMLIAAPVSADVFFARNQLRVEPTRDPFLFEVISQGGTGGSEYFCAAGQYARFALRARAADRVVIVRGARPNPRFARQRTVLMTVVPRGTPLPQSFGLFLNQRARGENLTVAHAQFLCNFPPSNDF